MYRISRCYSEEFIKEVVERIKLGELSAHSARIVYGIGGKMTIYRWLSRYDIERANPRRYQMVKIKKTISKKTISRSEDSDIALQEAHLRLEYYETLFSLAKEEYGIDIKKVLGTIHRGNVKANEDNQALSDGS